MSIKIMSAVWESSKQSGGTLLVLLALADFADDNGYCFPAVKTLATKARLSERQTQRTLAELEKAGEIAVHHCQGAKQFGKGIGFTNRYQVLLRKGCQNVTPLPDRGDISGTIGVTFVTDRGDAHVTQTVIEPPLRTPSLTTLTDTTTQDTSEQYADETRAQGREGELLERGERCTTSRNPLFPTVRSYQASPVRTASRGQEQVQKSLQALQHIEMSSATSRKDNTLSDSQTTTTSPVQPTREAIQQILQAWHQTRFNKPCSEPQVAMALMDRAAELYNAGYTPAQVSKATRNAMERWSQPENATLRAITKHIASLLQPTESSFVRQSDQSYFTKPQREVPVVTKPKSFAPTTTLSQEEIREGLADILADMKELAKKTQCRKRP